MEKIVEFATNNFGWIITITILLFFGLIGYIVDSKRTKDNILKQDEEEINEDYLKNLLLNDETKKDINIIGEKIETDVNSTNNIDTQNINN